jgi:F0F1-type ATP synthase membrane subunit c/vacuolar-type H+-ATPase subunit K
MPLKLRRTVMIWKTLTTIAAALILGATSLAMAQAQGSSGPDGMSAAAAADNPPAPKHHKKMYMSAKHKKGSQKTDTNGGY